MDFEVKFRVSQQVLGNALAALQRDPTVVMFDLDINPLPENPTLLPPPVKPKVVEDEVVEEELGGGQKKTAIRVARAWVTNHALKLFATSDMEEVLHLNGFAKGRTTAVLQALRQAGAISSKRRGWWTVNKMAGTPLVLADHIVALIKAEGPVTMKRMEKMAAAHGFKETGVGPRLSKLTTDRVLVKIPPAKQGGHSHWALPEQTQSTDDPPVEQTVNQETEPDPGLPPHSL